MTRNAGRLALSVVAMLAAAGAALGADAARYDSRGCGSEGEIVTTRYKEQICYGGHYGYAACRWVNREHQVLIPAECGRPVTSEEAWPADRGAMPRQQSLVAKG